MSQYSLKTFYFEALRLCIFNDIDRKAYDSELEKKKKQSNKFLFDLNEANLVLSDDVKVVFLTKKSVRCRTCIQTSL